MNDRELEQLLKSAKMPERPADYWRDFPQRISAKLHWQPQAEKPVHHPRLDTWLAWTTGLATVCIVTLFLVRSGPVTKPLPTAQSDPAKDTQLADARKCYREIESLFANQLQAIVFDQKGPRMILADRANLPDATPLYLKVCSSSGCVAFVTFSGQHIPFNGENCEVLADGRDQVMLVGDRHVWSSSEAGDVSVEARRL